MWLRYANVEVSIIFNTWTSHFYDIRLTAVTVENNW